jgi:2-dehydropantoate 2-reductase
MLARAGHSVILIGRSSHVEAILEGGLFVEAKTFQGVVPVQATTDASCATGADVVLFCVKSGDTAAAGQAISPYLREETTVLSMQNGVDNAERLQAVIGQAVVPAAVYVATELVRPGHVKHHGRGELVIGPSPASHELAAAFTEAGVPTTVSDDVFNALWSKLIINCCYNALSAVSQLPYGRLLGVSEAVDVMRDVVNECLSVAEASGVSLSGDVLGSVIAIAGTMPDQYSSTAQDVARGKTSEIDFLNGFVVRKGAKLGIPTPANRALHAMVRLVEAKAQGK